MLPALWQEGSQHVLAAWLSQHGMDFAELAAMGCNALSASAVWCRSGTAMANANTAEAWCWPPACEAGNGAKGAGSPPPCPHGVEASPLGSGNWIPTLGTVRQGCDARVMGTDEPLLVPRPVLNVFPSS